MSRSRSVLAAVTLLAPLLLSQRALAVIDPTPDPKDSRIRTTPYDPGQVVRLTSTGLSPLQVIFEDGEHPVTIAGALVFTDPKEAKDWLARPSGNVLILQPLRAMEPSVLFVRTTTADGKERHYSFELRTRDGSVADTADPDAYMTVRLTYPPVPSPEAIAAARARREAAQAGAEERAAAGPLRSDGRSGPEKLQLRQARPRRLPASGAFVGFR